MIESQFSVLLDKIKSTSDFEDIALAHDSFVTMLLSRHFSAHATGKVLYSLIL